ncbi:MAG: phosphoglycerate kinase [Thermoprotei archaeon]
MPGLLDGGLRIPDYVGMDEMCFGGLVTLLRVDVNSPIDPTTGKIIDYTRIKSHIPTIKKLISQGAKTILLAHQGQKGSQDFVSLRTHAEALSHIAGLNVKFVPEVYGRLVDEAVNQLEGGEVLMLENTRFVDEETRDVPCKEHANSQLVKSLSLKAAAYINDAFAASHRNHASLVGFPYVLPAFAGELMVTELKALNKVVGGDLRPTVFLIGGGKVADSIRIIQRILESNTADKIVVTGLVGNIFLLASGAKLGKRMSQYVVDKGLEDMVTATRRLLERHSSKIVLPVDLAVERSGKRIEVDTNSVADDDSVLDIGPRTIGMIRDEIKGFRTAFMRGPAGVVEKPGFELGTAQLLQLLAELGIYTVIGGGHTRIMAEKMKLVDKLGYASTGGGALLTFLSGEPLPALEALSKAVQRTRLFIKRTHER